MNQVQHIGRAPNDALYPKAFALFRDRLLLLADEALLPYRLAGETVERWPEMRLAFDVPLFEVIFRNISAVSDTRLVVVNELSTARGLFVHTFDENLALLSADKIQNDDFADVVCCSVDCIVLFDPPTVFRVLRRQGEEWLGEEVVSLPQPPIAYHRLEALQSATNEAVFWCGFVHEAHRHFCVVDAAAQPPQASEWRSVAKDVKPVFADGVLTVLISAAETTLHLAGQSLPALQLRDRRYALGAARVPGQGHLYALWGDAVRFFDCLAGTVVRVIECRFETVVCFPLSADAAIAISFFKAELVSAADRRLLITFAPHILAAV